MNKVNQMEENAMKKTVSLLCLIGLVLVTPLCAQPSDESVLTYEVIQSERKDLAMGALDLTKEQNEALSPIYDAYLEDLAVLEQMRLRLVREFMARHKAIADDEARVLLNLVMLIDQTRLDLHKEYTNEFGKVLPPRIVLRLWQVENKLDTIVNMQFVKEIPLAR